MFHSTTVVCEWQTYNAFCAFVSVRLCGPSRLRHEKPPKLWPGERSVITVNVFEVAFSRTFTGFWWNTDVWFLFWFSLDFRTGRNLVTLSLMHQVPMLPPPQSVMMCSWLSFPAKRWGSVELYVFFFCSAAHWYLTVHNVFNWFYLVTDKLISPPAGLERPRPGWGSHEQTERTEDCVLSYLQRRPLDHPLSLQGHSGPHAEGAGWAAWPFHRRQGEACWLW